VDVRVNFATVIEIAVRTFFLRRFFRRAVQQIVQFEFAFQVLNLLNQQFKIKPILGPAKI